MIPVQVVTVSLVGQAKILACHDGLVCKFVIFGCTL